MAVRRDPLNEHGSEPPNGRGELKETKKNKGRDCKGCPSSREKTNNHVKDKT